MKPMRTPLTKTRIARCKAVIEGYGPEVTFRVFRDLCNRRPNAIFDMLTDEAVELWAFNIMEDRVSIIRWSARNRAVYAARRVEAAS
jgi:hypothetical protein